MHLEIKQANDRTEQVSSTCIDKLYNLSKNDLLDATSDLRGSINAANAYEDAVTFLNTMWGPNLIVTAAAYYIRFDDDNVKQALLNAGFGDGTGITTAQANVAVFGNLFSGNTDIQYFDEFEKFNAQATSTNSKYSFFGCTNLKRIRIPSSAKTIWNSAFRGCTQLSSVILPDGLETLQDSCFRECSGLTSIVIPNSVQSLIGSCFYESGLTDVDLGTGVQTIGPHTFRSCLFSEIEIPDSVTSIGPDAFNRCRNLTKITFGSGVTSMGSEAFRYDNSITTVIVKDLDAWTNINVADATATPLCSAQHLTYNDQYVTNYQFPSGRTNVGKYCFYNVVDLISVTIPAGYTVIGDYAFNGCTSLQTITCGDSSQITTIGHRAFQNLRLQFPNFPNVTSVGDSAFSQSNTWPYDSQTEIVGFNNLTSVGTESFQRNQNIKTINITNCTNLDKKGTFAYTRIDKFGGPNSTSGELNLPNVVGAIGEQCFRSSKNINKVIIGEGCTNIKSYAFLECSNLTIADLPSTITSIGTSVFVQNGNNMTIILRATNPPSVSQTPGSIDSGTTVYVPNGSLTAYQQNSGWAALIQKGVILIEGIPTT